MDGYWVSRPFFLLDFKLSGVIVDDCDFYFYGVIRKERFDAFGPFHEAWVARVEIVVESEVEGFFGAIDAIEVEVVDCAFVAFVFVYDGERWAVDLFDNAKFLADGFDEGGFTGTHLSVEGE